MRLDVNFDTRRVTDALKAVGAKTYPEVKAATQKIGRKFVAQVTRSGLSGRPGLIRRSGTLTRSLLVRTTGTNLFSLETVAGFLDGRAAQIARVHELGTVGKGGNLPDIVPRKAKLLRWFQRAESAALSSEGGFVFAKKVSIPARLGFRATWRKLDVRAILTDAEKRWARSR